MNGISIIICCYNSAQRLPKTLQHIAQQKIDKNISLKWELIIVNNASTDSTVNVAKKEWKKYSINVNLKIAEQPIQGLSFARQKGIEVAKYNYLLFCDDDNWLNNNYVDTAYSTMELHPEVGVLGGQMIGFFEIEKPFWFDHFSQSYAVEKPMNSSGYISYPREYLAGAGMIIRKEFINALQNVNFNPILTGRIGNSLMSGEDYELCLLSQYLGFKIYFEEKLVLTHFISRKRLTWDYFLKMTTEGQAIPEIIYDLYRIVNYYKQNKVKYPFNIIYLKQLAFYFIEMLSCKKHNIKGFLSFLLNLQLFFIKKPGMNCQRILLSSKNKFFFFLTNKKLIKNYFNRINILFKNINIRKNNITNNSYAE